MRATRPLFRFDPGWLFIAAGLAVCAAGVLLPAQADLRSLEEQLDVLHDEEARAYQRLAAHADFIDQVDRSEPAIIKRLAAAQLNLVPEGDKPVVLAANNIAPVTNWIDSTLITDIRPVEFEPVSTLSRWANGSSRLWMFGGGIMAVFIGLLISPEGSKRRGRSSSPRAAETPVGAWATAGTFVHAVTEDADDADFLRAQQMVMRFAMPEISLPETVDVEDRIDQANDADTVDLEENELPALSRTVIDDDAAWHDAATIEHAAEVVVHAREVDETGSSGVESVEADATAEIELDENDSVFAPVSVSASNFDEGEDASHVGDVQDRQPVCDESETVSMTETIAPCTVETNARDWSAEDDARLDAAAMLSDSPERAERTINDEIEAVNEHESIAQGEAGVDMDGQGPEADSSSTADVNAEDEFGSEPPPVVELESLKAELSGADSSQPAETPRLKSPAAMASKKPRKPGKTAERKPTGKKSRRPTGDADAIPFLRYRPTDEDDAVAADDVADEVEPVAEADDVMIAMDGEDDATDHSDDATDDDGPLQFR